MVVKKTEDISTPMVTAIDVNRIIGHFGSSFYSSFMVAQKVENDTLSYKEGVQAVHIVSG
ncbi:MAG: hypothetical protein KME30_22700 [Iphinoe sp. HA4291-MV1]|jgi:HSP90 family molecular chaperone|nr:hypothetical protein [Iphinoe sp. HA4291-MV1]